MNRICIEPAANGYVITYDDPEIHTANRTSGPDAPWVDPEVKVVAETEESVATVLATILPKLKPQAPSESFAEAFKEASEQ